MLIPGHTLHWKGWGIQVFVWAMGWPFAVVFAVLVTGYHEPDPHRVSVAVLRFFALAEGLAAVSIWLVSAWRESVAPGVDQFMWLPVWVWNLAIAAVAAALLVASFYVR